MPHFLPAVRAINTFKEQIGERIRKTLRPYDKDLNDLGVASSTISKLHFVPVPGGEEEPLCVQIKNSGSCFYIYVDLEPDDQPTPTLEVGFWLWTPAASDRKELYSALRAAWTADGFETDEQERTVFIVVHVDLQENFPDFEPVLQKLIPHVIKGLKAIDFVRRFGPGFAKRRVALAGDKGESPAE